MKVSSEGSIYSQSLGKYWQLNQSNRHTSTYSRIQQQTKNPCYATMHNEYAQENPRINRQERWKVTFPGCLPQGDLPAVHSRYIHRSSALPVGPLGGLPSLSLTTEGSWIHHGGRSPKLSSARWCQYPRQTDVRHASSLNASTLWGWGITTSILGL